MLRPLVESNSERVKAVIGDGAYDSRDNYEVVKSWGATPIFPSPENAI